MRGNTGALAVRGAAGRTGSAYPALLVLAGMFFALVSSSAVRQPVAQLSAEASKLTGLPLTAQATISGELGRDRSEYHARATAHGPRIRNSGHDLVATFGRDGIVVDANAGRLELRLEAMGNGSRLYAAPAARPTATENRVEYRRGRLTEWYINGPLGLEQGFTIARPLAESRGPLTLAFAVSGTLRGSLDEGATGLRLALPGQRASLRYYGLAAWDAGGRELPAWLTFDGKTLRLRVEATGAAYPITIDPIFEQAKLTASDGAAFDNFGASIAISGDTVVVGSPSDDISGKSDQGSAYVFVKPGGGWASGTQTAKLTASDGDEFDKFGTSVAVSGDTVVVGAPGDDFGVEEDLGSAYVFVKPGGGWVNGIQTAKLAASNGIDFDSVGTSVGVSGDVAVAGAPGTDIGANDDQGSVYVYVKPGGGWVNANQTAELTVSGGLAFDSFGTSVAIDVDTIVGAAPFTDANRGAAYVYVKPGGGWASGTETARLTASDAGDFDQFGEAVSVSGDTVVVGARMGDGVAADTGAAYVYVKPAGAWVNATQTAKLTASDGVGGDAFGSSVSVDGDTIVAGSYFDQVGMMFVQGSAYLFLKPGGGWVNGNETDKLLASDGNLGDLFGKAVSVDGATIAVGAYSDDDVGGASDRGSAYIFPVGAPMEPGNLQVATIPAVATQIIIDGEIRDSWGLNWLHLPPGTYTLSFTHVEGFTEPAPQQVTITSGQTTTVNANFTARGSLRVITNPAVWATISVDGVPRDDFGMWTDLPAGNYQVCFGPVVGFDAPPCQNAVVTASQQTTITGNYASNPNAIGETNKGFLRVETSPAVRTQVMVDGVIRDSWGLNWLKLTPGPHTVSFTGVEGYTPPPQQQVNITAGQTTTLIAPFAQRGFLRVITNPAVWANILVDGVPRNAFGMWTDIPTGSHQVCFGPVIGFTPPPCQNANVTAGQLTTITGNYS
jgi:FG-GAP repeat